MLKENKENRQYRQNKETDPKWNTNNLVEEMEL